MKNQTKTRILCITEGAIILAFAFVLELLCVYLNNITGISALLPFGGTVTVSMLPIVYYSYRRGAAWGMGSGFVYAMLQMLLGFYIPPANTWWAVLLCILLDYLLAFTVLGLANIFAKPFVRHRLWGYCMGAAAVCIIRFAASFLSGIILWDSYAPEGMSVWLYSLIYNGSYMLPSAVLTSVFTVIVCAAVDPLTLCPMRR